MLIQLLAIACGGALGSVLRFLVASNVQNLFFSGWLFPAGTFLVNITGCLVIGLLGGVAEYRGAFSPELRAFLFIGILGGYTTFSTFGFETFQLLRSGQILYAMANGLGQLVCGLVSVWLGFILAKVIWG